MLLGFENYHGIFETVLNKCTEFDPARRYKNISELKRAIELRSNYLRLKKFFIIGATAGIFFITLSFGINFAESPQVEIVESEILQDSILKDSSQDKKIAVTTLPVEEKTITQENFVESPPPEIFSTQSSSPQKVFEPAEPAQEKISQPAEEKSSDKISELIEEYNKNPATYEVEKPQRSFENWKKNNYVSEGEEVQRKKFDEELKWIEVQQRTRNFVESLPEGIDKAKARHEFYKSELRRLNLE